MKYYQYDTDANHYNAYRLLEKHHKVIEIRHRLTPVQRKWKPISVMGFADNPGRDGDFPTLNDYGQIPLFSVRAWNVLKPVIGYCTEALPITSPDGQQLFLIHVMDIIDCLDEVKSNVHRTEVDGRVYRVDHYVFKQDLVDGKHIFKLPIKSGSDLIISDLFRKTCQREKLVGLKFKTLPMAT